jgi:tetratricopeptide (TPR) repeat protein
MASVDDPRMASMRDRPSGVGGPTPAIRPLPFAVALLGLAAVVVGAGWAGWLAIPFAEAWQWVQQQWLASSAAVVLAALGVGVALATVRRRNSRAERLAAVDRAEWEQRCRSLLAQWPPPAVRHVDPYRLGVFYSRRAEAHKADHAARPPYVPRASDKDLVRLLRSHPLVLIKGRASAGKTRTAFEAAAQALGDWRLLVPKDRVALTALAALDPLPGEGQPVLVWLDNLERYLSVAAAGGLNAALLDRWAASDSPVHVVATIRLEDHDRLMSTKGELGRTVRKLLERFDPGSLILPATFDGPGEQAAIARLYPGEPVAGGLAEHLAAAKELVDRLEAGQASVPEGAGLVLAAVDCRRSGLDRPIGKADLAALLPFYLERLRPDTPIQDGDVDRGLGWATDPVGRTAALLIADPDPLAGTFRVADPIVDYIERRHGRQLAHPAVWHHLLAHTSPDETMMVGFVAYTREAPDAATTAWRKIASSSHPDEAAMAAFNLGLLLEELGDVPGARGAFLQAIEARLHDVAPEAAVNRGALLEERGGVAGARAVLQQVIDAVRPDETPAATLNVGLLLEERGNLAGARGAYQQAIDSGHPDAAPRAMLQLGLLHHAQGDTVGALAAYQQAIDSGHPDETPAALVNLGSMLKELGNLAGALAAYQQAIDSGHQDAAPRAMVNLGLLLAAQGATAAACTAYQQAIDSGHVDERPAAAFNLGLLLEELGDVAGALAAYQQAIDSGHPDAAPRAIVNLGVLLEEQGDVAGARAAYQQAIRSGHPDEAPAAAFNLGVLLHAQTQTAGARAAYQQAIDSGHRDAAPRAMVNLGVLLHSQGDLAGARDLLQQAIASGHPEATRQAQQALDGSGDRHRNM